MAATLLEKLGNMVGEQIRNEASIFLNFRKDFEWLSDIRSYLKDADLHSAHDEGVKKWLLHVADIAWDAEDILEEYAVESNDDSTRSSCVCPFCPFDFSQLLLQYKMGRRIKDVKDRMRTIMEDGDKLKLVRDLSHSDQASTSTSRDVKWKRTSIIESDARPVAIESKVDEIISLLYDPAVPVIAVVGMGGVGKTFLMQNVFNRVKARFEISIWLAISQSYSLQQLQRDLASKIRSADVLNGRASDISLDDVVNGSVSEIQAAESIHRRLESARCLIVLDDVWRASGKDKLISTLGLPTGNNTQCKIVVTTRISEVSRNMNVSRVYQMNPLSKEESWELFCAFAFPDCEQNPPPRQLMEIAHQIEMECARLPLAVKTVAASLEGRTSSREWDSKLRELKEVAKRGDPIMEILKLSYDSLPAPLKPCFAYLSFFPEDESIDPQYLINLWIAEGFIHAGKDQLEIGWKYIYNLVNLCLLEIEEEYYDQKWKMCKVHDLLLDLAISISEESQCAFRVGGAFTKDPSLQRSSGCRRILLAKKSIDNDVIGSTSAYSASRLRTLSLSQNHGIENIPANLFNGVRVLRVLDLSYTSISALPTCVGNFKLLRVLNLSGTEIKEVPESVRSIKSLRVLDISNCRNVEQLPVWIGELNCLDYLDIRGCKEQCVRRIPKGVSMLVSLQALRSYPGLRLASNNEGDNEWLKVEHLVNLVNLREVGIEVRDVEVLKRIEEGILAPLANMRNLTIRNDVERVNYDEESNLPPLSEKMLDMKDLEILELWRFGVPRWICGFSNLMQLDLLYCHCADYPALQTMPNLIRLEMWFNNNCRVLPKGFGKARGFPQLRYLQISYFSLLEELAELEDGAMPRLEILNVRWCERVKKVPGGLELLKSLKECHFEDTGTDAFKEELNKIKEKKPNVRIVVE